MMNRREVLFSIGGGIAASMLRAPTWAIEPEIPKRTKLGIDDLAITMRIPLVPDCFGMYTVRNAVESLLAQSLWRV